MTRLGNMYGPDATFLGIPMGDPDDVNQWKDSGAVILGAPFDGGTSHRSGCRFGPQAIRLTDYLPHDGMRPSMALGVDPLVELNVLDLGDVEMPSGDTERSLKALEDRVTAIAAQGVVPIILGGDHTIALPDVTGIARHVGWGRVSVIHFDAHADTGDTQFGSLQGPAAVTASCRSVFGATGPSRKPCTGWPSRACVPSKWGKLWPADSMPFWTKR